MLTEYAAARKSAEYHEKKNGEHGVWNVKCNIALPCATQNELNLDDAKALVANGCFAVAEGANMPTTLEATQYLQENGILFCPGKASNAGYVNPVSYDNSIPQEKLEEFYRKYGIINGKEKASDLAQENSIPEDKNS